MSELESSLSDPEQYGRGFDDVYDEWYADLSDPADVVTVMDGLVDRGTLHDLGATGGGTLLELGAGTGRLALPLAEAGWTVVALDVSLGMLARLQNKHRVAATDSRHAPVAIAADMSSTPLKAASVHATIIAFNTLFNLDRESAQIACLREVHRVLHPGGVLAIEAFVPEERAQELGDGYVLEEATPRPGHDVIIATRHFRADRRVHGAHLDFSPDGLRVRPWRVRYLQPEAIDDLAGAAGLRTIARWSDWARSPFTPESTRHVTIYEKSLT